MRWVLRLIGTSDELRSRSADLMEICRPEGVGALADLGLTLSEAKQLLRNVQQAVVAAQLRRRHQSDSARLAGRQGCQRGKGAIGPICLSHSRATWRVRSDAARPMELAPTTMLRCAVAARAISALQSASARSTRAFGREAIRDIQPDGFGPSGEQERAITDPAATSQHDGLPGRINRHDGRAKFRASDTVVRIEFSRARGCDGPSFIQSSLDGDSIVDCVTAHESDIVAATRN